MLRTAVHLFRLKRLYQVAAKRSSKRARTFVGGELSFNPRGDAVRDCILKPEGAMETRRRTVFRVSELDELRKQLATLLSADELERRHRAIERMKRYQESMPVIPGDIKHWIRAGRGETAGD
jgi:hypothetical protein